VTRDQLGLGHRFDKDSFGFKKGSNGVETCCAHSVSKFDEINVNLNLSLVLQIIACQRVHLRLLGREVPSMLEVCESFCVRLDVL